MTHGIFCQKFLALYFFSEIERIKSMIHNSSNDPVLIKKISLKIWSLRDEIESRIQTELEKNPDAEINYDSIRDSYIKSAPVNNVVEISNTSSLDDSEDEMARAMRGEEPSPEEAAIETSAEAETAVENNVVALNVPNNQISITLDIPNIDENKISKGKTVLSEINMEKMFFFCNKPFTEGQSIVIQFCIPKMFIMNADILYCRPFNLKSRIISQNNFNYRALIRFTFLKEGERALLRQFIQSIEPDVQKSDKKSSKSNSDNGDDSGFGELDDLGL
jgi:hypothetical protein